MLKVSRDSRGFRGDSRGFCGILEKMYEVSEVSHPSSIYILIRTDPLMVVDDSSNFRRVKPVLGKSRRVENST